MSKKEISMETQKFWRRVQYAEKTGKYKLSGLSLFDFVLQKDYKSRGLPFIAFTKRQVKAVLPDGRRNVLSQF